MRALIPADVDRLFAEALSRGDIDGALAMYEPDACFDDGRGEPAYGHDQIRKKLEALAAQDGKLDCYEIDVLENGDLAVLRARWIFTSVDETGQRQEHRGRSIEIVRRQPDGSWKFTIDLPSGAS